MLIVPLINDKLLLRGKDDLYLVSSYTGYKSEPSVYLKSSLPDGTRFIKFSDIIEVNNIPVEYKENSKILKALGPLKRAIHIPQIGDIVSYTLVDTNFNKEIIKSEVKDLKLHSIKNKSHSLQVKLNNINLGIAAILDIERDDFHEIEFNRAKFQNIYIDYLGI